MLKRRKKKKKKNSAILLLRYKKHHLKRLRGHLYSQYTQTGQRKSVDRFVLRSFSSCVVYSREYAALRRILSRKLQRLARLVMRTKPVYMKTAKPKEMRMGKGKGAFHSYYLHAQCGKPLGTLGWCPKLPTYWSLWIVKASVKKGSFRFFL